MTRAFVLINVDSGSEEAVSKRIKEIGIVEEVYVSYGVYDLIIKIRADNIEDLKEIISHKVRTIKNVHSTLTLILLE